MIFYDLVACALCAELGSGERWGSQDQISNEERKQQLYFGEGCRLREQRSAVEGDLSGLRRTDPTWPAVWKCLRSDSVVVVGEDSDWDAGLEVLLCSALLFVFGKILATTLFPMDSNVFL